MYTIYALIFSDKSVYIGLTSNLKKRITDHKYGKTRYTKDRDIEKVIEIESCIDRKTARTREKFWKSGCGREQIKFCALSSAG